MKIHSLHLASCVLSSSVFLETEHLKLSPHLQIRVAVPTITASGSACLAVLLLFALRAVSASATETDSAGDSSPVPAPISAATGIAAVGEIRLQHDGKLAVSQHGMSLRATGNSILEIDAARLEVDGEILILSGPKLVKTTPNPKEFSSRKSSIRAIPQCVSISALGKVKLTLPGGTPVEGQTAAYRVKQQQWFVDGKPVRPPAKTGNPAGK